MSDNRQQAEAHAREDIETLCRRGTDVHKAYLDYCEQHGPISHAAFAEFHERINSRIWQRQVSRAMQELIAEEW